MFGKQQLPEYILLLIVNKLPNVSRQLIADLHRTCQYLFSILPVN